MLWKSGQPLPLHIQKLLLDQTFSGTICRIKRQALTWEGWLTPSSISKLYLIRLVYKLGDVPQVFLLAPDPYALANSTIQGRRLPHVYGGDPVRLCLYLPGSGEWKPNDALATTVLPWTCEWLGFFEDWVFTNIWSGGGVHPEPKETEAMEPESKAQEDSGAPQSKASLAQPNAPPPIQKDALSCS